MKKYLVALLAAVITSVNAGLTVGTYKLTHTPLEVRERVVERVEERRVEVVPEQLDKQLAFSLIQATVSIETTSGSGSGVFVYCGQRNDKEDKHYYSYILTCAHVVHNYQNVTVHQYHYTDGKEITEESHGKGTVVFKDEAHDIAVVEFKSMAKIEHTVEVVDPERYARLVLNDPVYAIGCPLDFPPYITQGSLACVGIPSHHHESVAGMLMISSPIMLGNSGGGIFTADGKLLGLAARVGGMSNGMIYNHAAIAVPIWTIVGDLTLNSMSFMLGDPLSSLDEYLEMRARIQAAKEFEKILKQLQSVK